MGDHVAEGPRKLILRFRGFFSAFEVAPPCAYNRCLPAEVVVFYLQNTIVGEDTACDGVLFKQEEPSSDFQS